MKRPAPRKRLGPAYGERNGNAVLLQDDVEYARRMRRKGATWVYIAEGLRVHESTVRRAVKGQTWRGAR